VATGRSNAGAAAGSGAGAGSTGLAAIGATATGFGTSAIATSRAGRGGAGGEGRRGATTGTDGNLTGCVAGKVNTLIDRIRGAEDSSDARVGTTAISTPANVTCAATLSHMPVLEREWARAHALNRALLNRTDMCRTELKVEACRSDDVLSVES
jgi:hypothetical protein